MRNTAIFGANREHKCGLWFAFVVSSTQGYTRGTTPCTIEGGFEFDDAAGIQNP